jgi:hypothetical protein
MRHILGSRKIISFKIGIKNISSYLKKQSLLSSDLEWLKKKTIIYVVLLVFLKWFIPVFVLFK